MRHLSEDPGSRETVRLADGLTSALEVPKPSDVRTGTLEDHTNEAVQSGIETVMVSKQPYNSSYFPLQERDKALVVGNEPDTPMTDAVAKLVRETNLAMINCNPAERRIKQSSTYPIVPGDIVAYRIVAFSMFDGSDNPAYVKLEGEDAKLFWYKVMPGENGDEISARLFIASSVELSDGKPYLGNPCIQVEYKDEEGETKRRHVTMPSATLGLTVRSLVKHGYDIVKVHGQLEAHVVYSKKKAKKELSEESETADNPGLKGVDMSIEVAERFVRETGVITNPGSGNNGQYGKQRSDTDSWLLGDVSSEVVGEMDQLRRKIEAKEANGTVEPRRDTPVTEIIPAQGSAKPALVQKENTSWLQDME